jgi:hypothetical protein
MDGQNTFLESNYPSSTSSSGPHRIFDLVSRQKRQLKEWDTAHGFGSRRQWEWLRRDHHETEGERWISGATRERDPTY